MCCFLYQCKLFISTYLCYRFLISETLYPHLYLCNYQWIFSSILEQVNVFRTYYKISIRIWLLKHSNNLRSHLKGIPHKLPIVFKFVFSGQQLELRYCTFLMSFLNSVFQSAYSQPILEKNTVWRYRLSLLRYMGFAKFGAAWINSLR